MTAEVKVAMVVTVVKVATVVKALAAVTVALSEEVMVAVAAAALTKKVEPIH